MANEYVEAVRRVIRESGMVPRVNAVQYIFLDRTLDMSTGKAAAQASHASVEGVLAHRDTLTGPYCDESDSLWRSWREGKHYAKVVLEVDDLFVTQAYLESRGFKTELIIDEGRTEFGGKLTPTALGTMIVDKDDPHTKATFGEFDVYGTYERKLSIKNARDIKAAISRQVEIESTRPKIVAFDQRLTRSQFKIIQDFLKK